MKKFYKIVSLREHEGAWAIELDRKPVKTPAGALMQAPTKAAADLCAEEWRMQKDNIIPDSMPVTQFLVTVVDRVQKDRGLIQESILKYLDTDLLCYRSPSPPPLVQRESDLRDPWIRWFEDRFGVALQKTESLSAIRQPEEAHEKAAFFITVLDDWRFNILQIVTSLTGSLVLALAFTAGAASDEECLKAFFIEEDYKSDIYNEEFYGRVPHQERAIESIRRDLNAAYRFLRAL